MIQKLLDFCCQNFKNQQLGYLLRGPPLRGATNFALIHPWGFTIQVLFKQTNKQTKKQILTYYSPELLDQFNY